MQRSLGRQRAGSVGKAFIQRFPEVIKPRRPGAKALQGIICVSGRQGPAVPAVSAGEPDSGVFRDAGPAVVCPEGSAGTGATDHGFNEVIGIMNMPVCGSLITVS